MPDTAELQGWMEREFPQSPHKIVEISPMFARTRYSVSERDLRPGDTISGPTLFSLADFALYAAILGEIGIVPLAVTTNMSINFLRKPAAGVDLVADCRLLKLGKVLAVGDVLMYSEGQDAPVAQATGTYSIPPGQR